MTAIDNTSEPQAVAVAGCLRRLATWLANSFMADRNRWFLWSPIFMGGGSSLYFALHDEPGLVLSFAPAILFCLIWFSIRRVPVPVGYKLALACMALVAVGFGAAKLRTTLVATPTLAASTGSIMVTGRVSATELADLGPRVVLDHVVIGDMPIAATPWRVRLRLTRYSPVPQAGSDIMVKAVIMPPPGPAEPGAHNFRRDSFFDGIGGVGYAVGRPVMLQGASEKPHAQWLERQRQFIAGRIRIALGTSPEAAIATAYLTGERGLINDQTANEMRNSGLAHLLAISGMKVGLVAVLVFGVTRFVFALIPSLALRLPVRKIAALCAILAALGYTGLASAPVPALRSVLMTGMAMSAILFDRQSFSLRLAAVAAILVTLTLPESVISVSFQMSFGAVVALISFYEAFRQHLARHMRHSGHVRRAFIEFAKIVVMTFIASLVTAPLALFHFQQEANYSIPANALAIPLNDFWIMPLGVMGLLLMPLGLDTWPMKGMGQGIHVMLVIARDVSAWPGAVTHVPVLPGFVLLTAGLGGLWIVLWRSRWRRLGVIPIAASVLAATFCLPRPPSIIVSEDASHVAIRMDDGRLAVSKIGKRDFTADSWNKANGARGVVAFPETGPLPGSRLECDSSACRYKGSEGEVAILRDPAETRQVCNTAAVVISRWTLQIDCGGPMVIDPDVLSKTGALTLTGLAGHYKITTMADVVGRRPWSPNTAATILPDGPEPGPGQP